MRVKVSMNRRGHLTLTPQSDKICRKIKKHLKSFGLEPDCTVYIQEDYNIAAFLEMLPRSKARDVDQGWGVTVNMDEWTYGHYVGWDAHEALSGCGKKHVGGIGGRGDYLKNREIGEDDILIMNADDVSVGIWAPPEDVDELCAQLDERYPEGAPHRAFDPAIDYGDYEDYE